jgi:protein-disulfide isomerase
MSLIKAVIRTAIYFGVLGALFAVQTHAQNGSEKPNGSTGAQPADLTKPRSTPNSKTEQEDIWLQIKELKQGQEQLRKEMRELKQLILALQAPRPGAPDKISVGQRPTRGSDIARVVVVEFSDYQCPYCAMFFRQTLPQLDQEYIKTGKIKYVFNNVPLDQLHPSAFKAAEAAECARDQGKFWEMHDQIFAHQKTLSIADLNAHAKTVVWSRRSLVGV